MSLVSIMNAHQTIIYVYYPTAGYKITYSVATLSYDNCYANLRDYSNSYYVIYYTLW
jgi:hypothetical protein